MNALAAVLLWVAAVGTFLVLGDDVLSLYKSIEFRAAITSQHDFALIVAMYTAVGLSATLILLALLAGAKALRRARSIVVACCLTSAIFAGIVLLLNGASLPEWPNRALEGKNDSAIWCLLVSLIYAAAMNRSRK